MNTKSILETRENLKNDSRNPNGSLPIGEELFYEKIAECLAEERMQHECFMQSSGGDVRAYVRHFSQVAFAVNMFTGEQVEVRSGSEVFRRNSYRFMGLFAVNDPEHGQVLSSGVCPLRKPCKDEYPHLYTDALHKISLDMGVAYVGNVTRHEMDAFRLRLEDDRQDYIDRVVVMDLDMATFCPPAPSHYLDVAKLPYSRLRDAVN